MIWDDNFDANVSEEITGEQTWEFDIAQNSGLLTEASNLDQTGSIYIAVYEDGKLVAEDTDPQYAQINYLHPRCSSCSWLKPCLQRLTARICCSV